MSVTERELEKISLVGNTITDTDKLKMLLETLAYTNNHVVDQRAIKAVESLLLLVVNGAILINLEGDMTIFLRYFPAAETMYEVFVAFAIGFILLNLVWQLFRNFGAGIGLSAEDPVKLVIRSVLFIFLAYFSADILELVLDIAGTPYSWITNAALPDLDFASFGSVLTVIVGCIASGSVSLIVLILLIALGWNYLKLLLEAAERYIMVGVLVYTAPMAFATGASENTSNIFNAWCRMLGGQLFLLIMNAWCLRLFVSMVGTFLANPLSV